MVKVKAKIMYFERTQGQTSEFIRVAVFPMNSGHAVEALHRAGFTNCGREHWMRKRKAYQKRRELKR